MRKSIKPELLMEWHLEANGNINPEDYTHGSTKNVWWICSKDKSHVWQAQINNRSNGTGCPYCKGKKPSHNRSVSCFPNLVKEWHPKNKDKPEDVLPSSNKKVWWKCAKADDHEWIASPNRRTSMKSGCPFCNGASVAKSNCLVTTHPELVKSWDEKNKIFPHEVTHGSTKKVWWKCEKCNRSYHSAVCTKTAGHGCARCKASIGEAKIKEFLERKQFRFEAQYRFKNCRRKNPLPFDFAVFIDEEIILIEFQGEFHYFLSRHKNAVEKLNKMRESDKIKKEYCQTNSLRLVEIRYDELNRIDEILSLTLEEK